MQTQPVGDLGHWGISKGWEETDDHFQDEYQVLKTLRHLIHRCVMMAKFDQTGRASCPVRQGGERMGGRSSPEYTQAVHVKSHICIWMISLVLGGLVLDERPPSL